MAAVLNKSETHPEGTAHGKGQEDKAVWETYLERRRIVLQFLRFNLSLQNLQHHWNKVELLKKCYFYLEIEPKHVNVTDQNHTMRRTDIFQLIDPWKFLKLKRLGKTQTETQLTLSTELLEQLEQGREELSYYIETCDVITFLSRWDLIIQRLSKLSKYMETLRSLEVPGKLFVKHHLVSHRDLRGARLPNIKLSLYTKMPLIFDRKESFAHKYWAKLKWFTENQESHLEQYELHLKLLTNGSQAEMGHCRIQQVTSNTCVVQALQPGRSYEFTIRRSTTHTLVFENWHDSIILKTKSNTAEDGQTRMFFSST
ncbi:fibronectin type III domain-containing protein 11 [Rhynochetos jubatus]